MRNRYFILFLVALLACIAGCKEKPQADFSKYITGYTGGVIKASSPITIYLSRKPDKGFQAGSTLPADVLKITPAVKGETRLGDDNRVEFVPSEPFKNGETYQVDFNLGALSEVPGEFKHFNFQFQIIPLTIVFESGNLTTEPEDENVLQYEGLLHSSDQMEPEQVEQMVTAAYAGQTVTPTWEHQGNRHYFRVRPLTKEDKEQTLTLRFSKEVKDAKEKSIRVPGRNEFTVLNVETTETIPAVINIFMSQNLDPSQDLTGLVRLENFNTLNVKIHDNVISIYTPSVEGNGAVTLTLYPGIQSITGNVLTEEYITTVHLRSMKPEVKLIGKGVIVPDRNKVLIPFSAVGLKAVDVEIIQVLQQNMNFFLQENAYNGGNELIRTARPVFMQKIDLTKDHPNLDLEKWNDFTIDLSQLVKLNKGTVYRIVLRFKKSYTTLPCADELPDSDYGTTDWNTTSDYAYYNEYYYPSNYTWAERDNPCNVSYYTSDRFESRNLINTSLGLMAKLGAGNRYVVCVNDLVTAEPVNNCKLSFYNYQNQKIDSAVTDNNGFARLQSATKAFIVLAEKDGDRAWLKLNDGGALSLSNFDVSGQHVQMGVKGFIYGERGVWRPGDEIYLSLILEDKLGSLPEGHPIVGQLIDPNGHTVQTLKENIGKNNIHSFRFKTDDDAQTGYWYALFRIGGLTFKKTLRIETIKPNRLAIQMEFPNDKIIGKGVSTAPVKVNTRWLNGAKTSNQKAITEVRLYNGNSGFKTFPEYTFSDRSKRFEPVTETLFDGTTNSEGSFSFPLTQLKTDNAPGVLNAVFTTRVFENGGDFSISSESILYSPYTEYVGIRLPQAEDNWYATKKPVKLSGVTVTPTGKQSGNADIRIEVYKLDWHWWWDATDENLSYYINREYSKSILNKTVQAKDGAFSTDLRIDEYGRYFIRATDPSGHSTGLIAYFGGWGEATDQATATMLHLSTDKQTYQVGEKIRVSFPSSEGAVAIVSLENGKTINDIRRIPAQAGTTVYETEATSDMCPNVYVAVTLIQPHNNRDNDRPIRLYGVLNVNVEDPALHLYPVVKIDKELRPGKSFTVDIREKEGRPMNYTIGIVDEGLLSLTTFRTPDPFSAFYAREALGVKTWDFYDYIYGAYGARLDKAFAVGGDEALKNMQDEKTNRFKPVVIFAGPFTLGAGQSESHTFKMPEYIGEVRTMVVAATNGQYGSASVNSTVSKPLMISVALPRLFTPGDVIDIPVTVFAMKDNIRDVSVKMTTDDKITVEGEATKTIRFDKPGEQVVFFKVRINDLTGVSTLRTEASSGAEKAVVTEDVTVRIPNPRITHVIAKEAKPKETVSFDTPITGDQPVSVLEISSIPPLNLEQRLTYLLDYPHGCAEQIVSKAFPQLSLPVLLALTPEQQIKAEDNVREVIRRLQTYQTTEGGFAYWPGSPYVSEWTTSYAVQFLVSAQQQGYNVPVQLLQNATNYMKKVANSWNRTEPWSQLEQSYRLFVLSLARRPDLAAMNRLKETQLQRPVCQWLLAAAYALSNQEGVAQKMIRNLSSDVASYRETGYTFGSSTRDKALILQCMVILDMQQDAYRMLEKISQAMGSSNWYSTQETAFSLHAAAEFVRKFLGSQRGIQVTVTTPEGKKEIKTEKTVWQLPLQVKNGKAVASVANNGEGTLFVRQINSSAPLEVVKERIMSGLDMQVRYLNARGVPLNIHHLKQGEDIVTEITIKNTGVTGTYQELALSYLVPSGFEIINERLAGNATLPGAENVDIRDDRFYVYFSLEQNQSKTFTFRCNAAFRGEYMLPAIDCSAMYDNSIQALLPGGEVTIE